ncbi:hypothetical protein [Priestia koreensis]|uniref:hypothetical protein n=1 Tax=Priestia koreensis TaxID=284581 RepID=UPI003F539B45
MEHTEQAPFQRGAYFKEKSKERSKIEGKNSELKHRYRSRYHGNARDRDHLHHHPKKNEEKAGSILFYGIDPAFLSYLLLII